MTTLKFTILLLTSPVVMCLSPGNGYGVEAKGQPTTLPPYRIMDVYSTAEKPSPVRYMGQPAKNGTIDLTSTNGFFDRCFIADDQQEGIAEDKPLIFVQYGHLRASQAGASGEVKGSARWHLWCPKAGQITVRFFMLVPPEEADHRWTIRLAGVLAGQVDEAPKPLFADEVATLGVVPSDGTSPQPQSLTFEVKQPGRITLSIDCTETPPPPGTTIRFIRLTGSAVKRASLLRTRWRPAAVHAGFRAPENCPDPKMWVFETRAVVDSPSYSPLTTPFGYFGTEFGKGGKINPGAGFNFSMWIAARNATEAPPLDRLPFVAHLIGTDIPEARYGSFGGEGTGVKFLGAVAYPHGAERTIQALRVKMTDGMVTYYGYFYDEDQQRWRLYASAANASRLLREHPERAKELDSVSLSYTGSFCEIPGPPDRERSGDVQRKIERRGWFRGSDGKWYSATLPLSKGLNSRTKARVKAIEAGERIFLNSNRIAFAPNYADEGWMVMATGGIECYYPGAQTSRDPVEAAVGVTLPEYLAPDKAAGLFHLPVEFGPSRATQVTDSSAVIEYDIERTGPRSKATLYYGLFDSATFTARKIKNGSIVEKQLFNPERTWQHSTAPKPISEGTARFELTGLKPGTTYFYRLFVEHNDGKSWAYTSGRFETR